MSVSASTANMALSAIQSGSWKQRRLWTLAVSAAVVLVVIGLAFRSRKHFRDAFSETFVVSVAVSWATMLTSMLIGSILFLSSMGTVWFTKAVKGRRTPGNVEIQTASVDLLDSSYDDVDDGLMRQQQQLQDDWHPNEHVPFFEKQLHKTPEDRLFWAFSRYAPKLDRDTFKEIFNAMEWHHLDADEVLYNGATEEPDGLYMVVEGVLSTYQDEVELEPSKTADELRSRRRRSRMFTTVPSIRPAMCQYHRSDIVSLVHLLTKTEQPYACIAETKADVVRISVESFKNLLEAQPAVMISFLRSALAKQWKVAYYVLRDFFGLPENEAEAGPSPLWTFFAKDTPRHEAMLSLAKEFSSFELARGQILFSSGSVQRKTLLLLMDGRVCLTPKEESNGSTESVELTCGAVFGGISFVCGSSHLETVRCLTPCTFVSISVQSFEANPHPLLVEMILCVYRTMAPLLMEYQRLGLHHHWVPAGKILFRDKDVANLIYVVVSGRLRVFHGTAAGEEKTVIEVGRGECLGEMALLAGDDVHSQNCITMRDSEIVMMPRSSLKPDMPNHSVFLRRFGSTMATRLRQISKSGGIAKSSEVVTIALIPASRRVNLIDFADRLTDALDLFGSAFHVSFDVLQEILKEDDTLGQLKDWNTDQHIFRAQVSHFLTDLEETHDIVVFSADRNNPEWSKCCIRQSDLILLVGDAFGPPQVSALEKELLWRTDETMSMSKRDLVLVHSDVTELPSGTRHWFPGRRLHAVHHVRKSEKAHYERLARVICRRAVGLVCSGGGSRGLAHMGSVQALHELSVPIDYIAGTSQGAFMGALYAIYGVQMDPVVRLFASRMGSVWQLLKDATLPVVSYFTGKTFSESIRQYFGEDTRIEDLWIPFVCVTTNLTKADVCVHRSGKVWEAVRASMSIVDYLPPMHVDGDLLIDGGYINNLPVDIMRDEFAPNTIIGVDVENKTSPFRNIKNYGYFLSGWWLSWVKLKSLLMPCCSQTKVPRFSEIVTSLAYMNHNRNIRHFLDSKVVDVYIRPELGQTLLLDYHKYDEIRDIGYRFTKVHMVRWMLQNRSLVSNFRSRGKSTSFSSPDLQGLLRSSNLSPVPKRSSSGGSADASPVRPTMINRSNSKRRMSTDDSGISVDTGKHITFSPTKVAIERD